MELPFGNGTIHQVVVQRQRDRRLKRDGNEPAQGRDAVCWVSPTVKGARLENRVAGGAGVDVGKNVVVAEDVILGWDANAVSRWANRAAGQDVVDASPDRARRDINVPYAVATFSWADALGEGLSAGIQWLAPSSERGYPMARTSVCISANFAGTR